MPVTGLGVETVVIGLGLYSLTILVRSMIDGLRAVPDDVRESALGMGYAPARLLWRVELPLALPTIMGGVRVATVSAVALTTVGAILDYGGLGSLLIEGSSTNFKAQVLFTSVLCVAARGGARPAPGRPAAGAHPLATDGGVAMINDVFAWLTDGSNWVGDGGDQALTRLYEHLLLTVVSVVMAMVVGLPLAVWLGHRGRGGTLAVNVSNIGRAIPIVALLALLSLGLFGSSVLGPFGRAGLATLVTLALFALPPIITNTWVGMREVDRDTVEAARGMGMSEGEVLRRVELPLALPIIFSGIRLGVRPGVGDGHHRGPGRGPRPGPDHHPRVRRGRPGRDHRRRPDRGRDRAAARGRTGRCAAASRPGGPGTDEIPRNGTLAAARTIASLSDPHRRVQGHGSPDTRGIPRRGTQKAGSTMRSNPARLIVTAALAIPLALTAGCGSDSFKEGR